MPGIGRRLLLALCGFVLAVSAQAGEAIQRLPLTVKPVSYDVSLEIDPAKPDFSGTVTIALDVSEPTNRILLHAARLTLDAITLTIADGAVALKASSLTQDGTIELLAPQPIPVGRANLSIRYHGVFASGLEGLYTVRDQGEAYAFTQFQAIGARRAFPCFDEPGFKARFALTLTVPATMKAVANTRELSNALTATGKRRFVFAPTPPLPTYLVAFAVGDFDIVEGRPIPPSAVRSVPVPLRGIAAKGKGKDLRFALASTAPLLAKIEDWFGIAYPFDKIDLIAVPDFGAVGMENAGLISYDEGLALLDDDASLQRQRDFVATHAHEITHQWFGNLATPRWWDDLWLNEAVATYMETRMAAWWKPDWRFDYDLKLAAVEAMALDLAPSVRRVREPVTTVDGISAAFDSITYLKGAALIGMAQSVMGEDGFRRFLHRFLMKHRFGTMDAPEFLAEMAATPKGDFAARALKGYLDQQGMPVFRVDRHCDKGHAVLTFRQSRLHAMAFPDDTDHTQWITPVCVSVAGDGREVCVQLDKMEARVKVDRAFCQGALVRSPKDTGYFAFDMPEEDLPAITKAIPSMPAGQALSVAADMELALASNHISIAAFLAGVRALSGHSDFDVRAFPLERLKALINEAPVGERREWLKGFVRELYEPQLVAIGLTTRFDERNVASWTKELYREKLVDLLSNTRAVPELERQLATLGQSIVSDAATNPGDSETVPADLVGYALIAASRTGDKPFLDQALARLDTSDLGNERALWIAAIAANRSPESSPVIRELVTSQRLRDQEVLALLFARAGEASYRQEAWALVEQLLPTLLRRLDGDLDLSLLQVADGFCSMAWADRIESAMRPVLKDIRGGSIQLDQTLDLVRACSVTAAALNREPLISKPAAIGNDAKP